MDKKKLIKKVVEKVSDKRNVDKSLVAPIKELVTILKRQSDESNIKGAILKFFKEFDMTTEKQAYVLETLIKTYDTQLLSPIHKKVLKDLTKKNTFVDIMF